MAHGWLDGRRGIPLLLEAPVAHLDAAGLADTEGKADTERAADTERPAETERGTGEHGDPWTPRMEALLRQSRERIEEECIRLADDMSVLAARVIEAASRVEDLTGRAQAQEQALGTAREPLGDTELGQRRTAERDPQRRPDDLVHARRLAAWGRRLSEAEERRHSAVAELARATQALRIGEELVRERAVVARSAARRHHELALRRVATYLQQLVRTHRRGPELNARFMNYRVGPDLPDWVRDDTQEGSGP
jgi:hypothetical protein